MNTEGDSSQKGALRHVYTTANTYENCVHLSKFQHFQVIIWCFIAELALFRLVFIGCSYTSGGSGSRGLGVLEIETLGWSLAPGGGKR